MGDTTNIIEKLIQAIAQDLPEESIESLLTPALVSAQDNMPSVIPDAMTDIEFPPSAESLIQQTQRILAATPPDDWSALVWAVEMGRLDIVQQLLPLDEVKMPDEQARQLATLCLQLIQQHAKGTSALHIAAKKGYEDILAFLLKCLVRIQEILPDANQALHNELAAKTNGYGNTPLILAANGNHLGSTRLLLQHGAPVAEENKGGWTALEMADDKEYTVISELLKQYWPGYQLKWQNLWQLHEIQYSHPAIVQKNIKAIQHYLIALILYNAGQYDKQSVNFSFSDSVQFNELIDSLKQKQYIDDNAHLALMHNSANIAAEDIEQIQQYIRLFQLDITNGEQLKTKNEDDDTSILIDVIRAYNWLPEVKGILELLLATRKIDVNAKSASEECALTRAIETGELNVVTLLKAYGCDINAPMDIINRSSLMLACYHQKFDIFCWLLKEKADQTLRTFLNNETVLLSVLSNIKNKPGVTSTAFIPYIRELLDHQADISAKDAKNNTVLISYANNLRDLLRPQFLTTQYIYDAPLFHNLLELMIKISSNNPTINDENDAGKTALSIIIESDLPEGIKLGFIGCLVTAGANLNKANKQGTTAVDLIKTKLNINSLEELNTKTQEVYAKLQTHMDALEIAKVTRAMNDLVLNKRSAPWDPAAGTPAKMGKFSHQDIAGPSSAPITSQKFGKN